MDLEEFSEWIASEIDNYSYESPAVGTIGNPWSAENVQSELRKLRSALISPYWAAIRRQDTFEQIQMANLPVCKCLVVARAMDVQGVIVAFDPAASEFLLAYEITYSIESFNVSGDLVGCFMAR